MRVNFGAKPLTYGQPVFILAAYDENGVANAMNAAWGGIADSDIVAIDLSEGHKTVQNILKTKAFTVSMGTADYVKECDYLGIESGNNNVDKMAKANLHTTKSEFVNAPLIDELPVAVECELISYDKETGVMLGKIINVSADEKVMTDGKVDITKVKPISLDPFTHTYVQLTNVVGQAFNCGLEIKNK